MVSPKSKTVVTAAVLAVIVFVVPVLVYISVGSGGYYPSEEYDEFATHIDHIIFVVLENHAFDNYFGDYCLVAGPYCSSINNGLPAGTCVPLNPNNPTGPCARPFPYTSENWTLTAPLPHDYLSSHLAWNNGSMDGFYLAEKSGLTPFGYYDASTAPIYYDIAEQYSLSDDFFSSLLSYSLPNHWHIVAGQAPQQIIANASVPGGNYDHAVSDAHLYLNQSNDTRSIEDLLLNSTVSWTYYDYTLGNYSSAIQIEEDEKGKVSGYGTAYDYWNPQAAKAESYNESFVEHFRPNTQFYSDARNGTLPALSWVIPAGQDSDHPPNNSTTAQGWVASLVNALASSPDWNSSVMYITWDDYGGFYDHVPPPVVDGAQQLGFRVPLLIVGPWVRQGFIDPQFGYFESVLRLMEWRFNLGCIAPSDCNAPLPLGAFNFGQDPRPPMLFPTNVSDAQYPMPLQSNSGWPLLPAYYPPSIYTSFPAGEAPDVD